MFHLPPFSGVAAAAVCAAGIGAAPSTQKATVAPTSLKLHAVRLYQPDDVLRKRIGDDVVPLAGFVRQVQAATETAVAGTVAGDAKGLLVAVGVKPDGAVRAWCQAVDGSIPQATLDAVAAAIGKVAAVPVHGGPLALAMELDVNGATPVEFPVLPETWSKAAGPKGALVPDGIFATLWPDAPPASQPNATSPTLGK